MLKQYYPDGIFYLLDQISLRLLLYFGEFIVQEGKHAFYLICGNSGPDDGQNNAKKRLEKRVKWRHSCGYRLHVRSN